MPSMRACTRSSIAGTLPRRRHWRSIADLNPSAKAAFSNSDRERSNMETSKNGCHATLRYVTGDRKASCALCFVHLRKLAPSMPAPISFPCF
jgi:hypothetical protein